MTVKTSICLIAGAMVAVAACGPKASVGSPGTPATPASAPAPAQASANRAPALPAGVTAATIAEGKTLYEAQANNCSRCHGPDAKGTNRGPNLTDSTWLHIDGSQPAIARIIHEGVPADKLKGQYQFPMAPKGRANLDDAQINAIAAYIWSLSHAH